MIREIRRNCVVLESTPGNSGNFVETQRIIARRAAESDHLVEEFIAAPMADRAWLGRRIAELVRKRGITLSGPVSCSANGFDELTTEGMHRSFFEPVLPPEWASCGVGSDLVRKYLCWTPSGIVDELIDPGDDGPEDAGPPGPPPDPVPKGMPFDFVSYSRADTNRVEPVIRRAANAGVQLWWDRHIPGGVEWDEYLEQQIQGQDVAAYICQLIRREIHDVTETLATSREQVAASGISDDELRAFFDEVRDEVWKAKYGEPNGAS